MVLLVLMATLKLTQNGNMECNDANISGKLTNKSSIAETVGPFTSADKERVKQIIMNPSIATTSDIEKYDLNGNNAIDIIDYFYVEKAVSAGGTLNLEGTFEINPMSASKTIRLINNKYSDPAVQLSLFGAFFRDLVSQDIEVYNEDQSQRAYINPFSIGCSVGENSEKNFVAGLTTVNDNDMMSIILSDFSNEQASAINGYAYTGNAYFELTASNGQTTVGSGGITTPTLTQTSKAENKKNFEKFSIEEARNILNNTEIYKYNLKTQEDNDKKHIGFVIGDEYNYAEEITSENNDGANIYSMTSVLYTVVQEQQKQIEKMQSQIKELKEECNGEN